MNFDNNSITSPRRRAAFCAAVTTTLVIAIITLALNAHYWPTTHDGYKVQHRRLFSLLDEDQDLPSLFPLEWPQGYIGFFCATVGLILAAGGGIGGGGILVPVYILLLQFPVKHAIPLTSVTVLGGAVANNLLNVRKVHPDHPERPAIDWDLMLQLVPTSIAGALIGADLNKILPGIVLLVLMLVLLSVTAQKTLSTAWKMYREEEKNLASENKHATNNRNGVATESTPLVNQKHLETDVEKDDVTDIHDSDDRAIKEQCINDAIKLFSLFTVTTLIDLLQGRGGGSSMGHWASEAFIFLCIVLFSLYVRSSILERQASGGVILSELKWDERNTVIYPLLSIIAGLVAGMFGLGGGIVQGPLMLALGVHPQVTSATSACMILFTSSTSALSFLIFGYLKLDYAAFCLVLGFLATLVGQTVMSALLKRSGRSSYIAFCIGGVVAISAVAMGIESVVVIASS